MPKFPAFLLLFFNCFFVSAQIRTYDKNALQADLRFLQHKLETIHPALYRYTSKPAFETFFDSLYKSITQPMDEMQFLSLITLLNAKIADGHTLFLPGVETTEHNNSIGKFFPFSVAYINGELFIKENNSSDITIKGGEKIKSINGEPTFTIMSKLMARQIRDGYNQTYPAWIFNHYFASYYSFAHGQPSRFVLELGNNTSKNIPALSKDSIKFFHDLRYPAPARQGITLELKDDKTAILTVKSFDSDIIHSVYRQNYTLLIDSFFTVLKRHGTPNLILDLRDNQGGDFENGRYLLSYLLMKPGRYLLSGKESRTIQPAPDHFTGKLFVLINGGSFSNTAIVSACLEKEQRAIFIGEETGGNKHIICGNATEIVLPKTWIRAFISTDSFQISDGPVNGRGVFPTHPVQPGIEDILAGKDVVKELAISKCNFF